MSAESSAPGDSAGRWESGRPLWSAAPGNRDGVALLSLAGELDLAAVEGLEHVLGEALDDAGDGLVVDMTTVSFCDSSCLNALLRAAARIRAAGARFALVAVSPAVVRPITVLNLGEALPITGSLAEAVKLVRAR
ncbi:STAS domain-containing protein [Amycolatopsis sp. 195334CR]|uniref:STAS domain-containing protein n=1 Tax=Amycolatopsis sp. 195334CR TaxID=2814588 RepID=UPI001A8E3300|nr:STAS domain-containing protein [Amycolatopsis sp. 195334CR]MBN6040518.1 STAS domain-containing protein [Amycolatopsis sp. 195334CR]